MGKPKDKAEGARMFRTFYKSSKPTEQTAGASLKSNGSIGSEHSTQSLLAPSEKKTRSRSPGFRLVHGFRIPWFRSSTPPPGPPDLHPLPQDRDVAAGVVGVDNIDTSTPVEPGPVTTIVTPASPNGATAKLWQRSIEIAEKKLSEKNLPPLGLDNLSTQPATEIIKLTIGDLEDKVRKHGDAGAGGGRWKNILKTIDRYARIVDTVIQHNPEITALVWAGIRASLQVALNHIEVMESLEAATVTIIAKMALCEFYARVYLETLKITLSAAQTTDSLEGILDLALPEFYAAVLVFSVKARQYFNPSNTIFQKMGHMFKPFAIEFQPSIEEMAEKEQRVRVCADMATMERIMNNSVQLQEMHSFLKQMEETLVPLNKISQVITQVSKAEEERIHKLWGILSLLESPANHQDIRAKRQEGTGIWLLKDEKFQLWHDRTTNNMNNVLCCYGIPGAGKTVISSIVIDHLISVYGAQSVAYIYCDYNNKTSQNLVNILGSLLKQFLSTASHIPESISNELESIQKQSKRPEISDILGMFKVISPQIKHSFVCIDALDELEPLVRIGLLKTLQEALASSRIFLTFREHIHPEVISTLKLDQQDAIEIIANPSDLRVYLTKEIELDKDINPGEMDEALKEEILEVIVEKAEKMFLLSALHISMVLAQTTTGARREALAQLPSKLDEAYECTIDRIQDSPQVSKLGMRVLLLLHLATRPFTLDELRHALAVDLEQARQGNVEFNFDKIPSQHRLLKCCFGLVILDSSEKTSTVRFVHYTLEEHFTKFHDKYFAEGYSVAAEICLTYLSCKEIATPCTAYADLRDRMQNWHFLKHAALNWGRYVRLWEQGNHAQAVEKPYIKLLRESAQRPHNIANQILYYFVEGARHYDIPQREVFFYEAYYKRALQFSGFHAAAYFGADTIIDDLAERHNWTDAVIQEFEPLSLAAWQGCETTVKLLLERQNVNADIKDKTGSTPLSYAAGKGHWAIARLLLEQRGVCADSEGSGGRTPLSHAAGEGNEAIVLLLMEREDVDADSKDYNGRTPLSYAAEEGHGVIMQMLMEREDVDADSKDLYGRTPLSFAAEEGYGVIVQMLMERGVDSDSKDGDGRTPLSYAAQSGLKAIVRMLREREDVNADSKDHIYGGTPLEFAAWYEHGAIMSMLKEREIVDVQQA